jgi:hypothetical protein
MRLLHVGSAAVAALLAVGASCSRDASLPAAPRGAVDTFVVAIAVGPGVLATPAEELVHLPRGTNFAYAFVAAGGYEGLTVELDGRPVAASGALRMEANHTLVVEASKSP